MAEQKPENGSGDPRLDAILAPTGGQSGRERSPEGRRGRNRGPERL